MESRQEPSTSCKVSRVAQNHTRENPTHPKVVQTRMQRKEARALSNNTFNKIKFLIAHLIH